MRLDRLITLNLVQPWRRIFSRTEALNDRGTETPSFPVPILMYHNITDAPEPGVAPYYQVNTAPAVFASHMQYLADHGYRTITISELVSLLNHRNTEPPQHRTTGSPAFTGYGVPASAGLPAETPKHRAVPPPREDTETPSLTSQPVIITFDDGFSSVYHEAYPILKKHGFTATVYLATAFIGDTPRPFSPAGAPRSPATAGKHRNTEALKHRSTVCLTWPECREMSAKGIEFGSHTVSHPKLVNMSWNEIRAELADSKRTIEDRLQSPCTQFCYPYAFPQVNTGFCRRLKNILCELGYESCATTQVGRVEAEEDPFQLDRLPANTRDDIDLLEAKLTGAYDWLAAPQALVKRAKSLRPRRHTEALSSNHRLES